MEKEPVNSGASDVAATKADSTTDLPESGEHQPRALTAVAERALAEAEERRAAARKSAKERAKELGGQRGPEPTRYGDWEKGGIVSDF